MQDIQITKRGAKHLAAVLGAHHLAAQKQHGFVQEVMNLNVGQRSIGHKPEVSTMSHAEKRVSRAIAALVDAGGFVVSWPDGRCVVSVPRYFPTELRILTAEEVHG